MQYSCAYFHNENIGLDQAQEDKKNHIINKEESMKYVMDNFGVTIGEEE